MKGGFMKKYRVTLQVSQYESMVVEAETEQEARDNALLRAERIYMGYVTVDDVEVDAVVNEQLAFQKIYNNLPTFEETENG
jgi:IMP cyclohydrolase